MRAGALAAGALSFGPAFWREAVAQTTVAGEGPYGPLQAADANGIMLPRGFRSRVVAQGNTPVGTTGYQFPPFPDGAATFATPDGGFIFTVNSENPLQGQGGVSALRFAPDGRVTGASRILSGTRMNCSGGATPWGTWMSCEEFDRGRVWECDPTGARPQGEVRTAMGVFSHEAVAVDPAGQRLYLTEDAGDGGFYRFTPASYPDTNAGLLEIATVGPGGRVTWKALPDPQFTGVTPTRLQVPGSTKFQRGEGMWFDSGVVYLATTTDAKIHAYDTRTERIEVIYDKASYRDPPLVDIDNITVSRSGDLFVCEDIGEGDSTEIDVGLIAPDRVASIFLRLTGAQHAGSEATGPAFDPSGTRFFFSSQRGLGGSGAVFEITGPLRLERPSSGPVAPGGGAAPIPPAPALGIEVPRAATFQRLVGPGLQVALTLDAPATAEVVLRGRFTPRRRGTRSRRAARTLARLRRDLPRGGPAVLEVPISDAGRLLLRGRRQALSIEVEVALVRADGQRQVVTRQVLVARPVRRGRAARSRRP